MAQKINGRVAFADLLRVFAILAVIIIHLSGSQMGQVAVTSRAWQVFNMYDGLAHWCVPVFIMLSGMFMLDNSRPLPLSKLLLHNCLRIVTCLLFWTGVYAVADYMLSGGGFSWRMLWRSMLSALLGNYHYHLWFMVMILGLYLVTPVLRAFCRGASRRDFHYFFVLAFFFASVLPTLFYLFPGSTTVGAIRAWYAWMDVHPVLGYVGYYVAGYYLLKYTISRLAEAIIYVLGIIGAIVTVWGTSVISRPAGGLVDAFYGYSAPNLVFFSVAVVVLFRYVLGVSEERSRRQRLSGVARLTFGIYLVHELLIMILRHLGVTTLSFDPVLSVPVLAALIFLCSFGIAWLIAHIPFLGRWLT